MALKYGVRVKETTTTTGTGTYTLDGAVTGFQSFASGVGNTNTTCYCCTDGTNWEIGVGTLSSSTLARTAIVASSNAGSAVNWGSGTRDIFCTFPYQLLQAIQGGADGVFRGTTSVNTIAGTNTVGIGIGNTVNSAASDSVVIGKNNQITSSGGEACILGCYNELGSSDQVCVIGKQGRANTESSAVVFSAGRYYNNGDTQTAYRSGYATTTDTTTTGVDPSELYSVNGYTSTIAYTIDVVARQTGGTSGTVGDSKWIRLEFLMQYSTTPTKTLVGSVTSTTLAASTGASAWTATIDLNESSSIRVTGEANKSILWAAFITGKEVGIP